MGTLSIGQVAKQAGVNIETLRYYERRGIVPSPPRTTANYRLYSPDDVRLVRFVRRAQDLGFSLRDIKELLAFRTDQDGNCADVRQQAIKKIADIDQRIHSLQAMRGSLSELVARCSGKGPVTGCPILESLEPPEVS